MTSIVVAVIGLLGSLAAVVVPHFLSTRLAQHSEIYGRTKPYSRAVMLIVSILSVFGVWGAKFYSDSGSLTSIMYFLVMVCICSVIYGNGSTRENHEFGKYLGYCAALVAGLLALWWLLGDWSYYSSESGLQIHAESHPFHILFALVVTAGYGLSFRQLHASRFNPEDRIRQVEP